MGDRPRGRTRSTSPCDGACKIRRKGLKVRSRPSLGAGSLTRWRRDPGHAPGPDPDRPRHRTEAAAPRAGGQRGRQARPRRSRDATHDARPPQRRARASRSSRPSSTATPSGSPTQTSSPLRARSPSPPACPPARETAGPRLRDVTSATRPRPGRSRPTACATTARPPSRPRPPKRDPDPRRRGPTTSSASPTADHQDAGSVAACSARERSDGRRHAPVSGMRRRLDAGRLGLAEAVAPGDVRAGRPVDPFDDVARVGDAVEDEVVVAASRRCRSRRRRCA